MSLTNIGTFVFTTKHIKLMPDDNNGNMPEFPEAKLASDRGHLALCVEEKLVAARRQHANKGLSVQSR